MLNGLSPVELWAPLFKPSAFLLHDESREQLLSHLLALTTVDLFAFTPHYPQVPMIYQVTIATAKCAWVYGACVWVMYS